MFVLSCFQQSPGLSNILGTTVLAWYLVHSLTLFCKLYLLSWMYQQAPEGGVGTHGCRNSILLHYSVNSFRDSLHMWDIHLIPIVFVLPLVFFSSVLRCLGPFQGPGWTATYSQGSSQEFHFSLLVRLLCGYRLTPVHERSDNS